MTPEVTLSHRATLTAGAHINTCIAYGRGRQQSKRMDWTADLMIFRINQQGIGKQTVPVLMRGSTIGIEVLVSRTVELPRGKWRQCPIEVMIQRDATVSINERTRLRENKVIHKDARQRSRKENVVGSKERGIINRIPIKCVVVNFNSVNGAAIPRGNVNIALGSIGRVARIVRANVVTKYAPNGGRAASPEEGNAIASRIVPIVVLHNVLAAVIVDIKISPILSRPTMVRKRLIPLYHTVVAIPLP